MEYLGLFATLTLLAFLRISYKRECKKGGLSRD
jgi:hypothetical protein